MILAGIGGLVRNNQGLILTEFATSIGVKDSNEILDSIIILFTLEMSLNMEWLQKVDFIIFFLKLYIQSRTDIKFNYRIRLKEGML